METWNLFTNNDLIIGLIGFVGVTSAIIVIASAFTKVNKREIAIKKATTYNMSSLTDFDDFVDEMIDEMEENEVK